MLMAALGMQGYLYPVSCVKLNIGKCLLLYGALVVILLTLNAWLWVLTPSMMTPSKDAKEHLVRQKKKALTTLELDK